MMIMAGGTGGHVIPALAVARELRDRGVDVSWIGTPQGLESRLVPNAGIDFDAIDIKGLRKSGLLRALAMPFMLAKAMFQTLGLIRNRKPDAVLGMGGFVSGPGGLVAAMMRIPLVLHEQNSVAGLTNKWLARLTRHVFTGFPAAAGISDFTWVGNPVRKEISDLPAPAQRLAGRTGPLRILVVGGSQGASVFNQNLPELLGNGGLAELEVWHQCGRQGDETIGLSYEDKGIAASVDTFIDDMAAAYEWCDFAICRAGAMTVSELCAAGVAALLVPYPHAVSDHQALNAAFMVEAGAAYMVRQEEFLTGNWVTEVSALGTDRQRLVTMSQHARDLSRPNAAEDVATACQEVMDA